MDWFRQNPFLGALAAATVVLCGAGAWFVYTGSAYYTEQADIYAERTGTLSRLQGAKPFPSDENRKAVTAEIAAAETTLKELAAYIESQSEPVQPMAPQEFQDVLSKKVAAATAAATAAGVALPDNFYLGFDAYSKQPPSASAAPLLGQQLNAIDKVIGILIKSKVKSILAINRRPLPGEDGAGADAGKKKDEKAAAKSAFLSLAPFDLSFTAEQPAARSAMAGIVTARPLVFIRLASVANSRPTPPPKDAAAAAPAQSPPPSSPFDGASPASEPPIPVLFGQEILTVNLRLAAISGPSKD